jgi:hypothetical protein
MSNFNPNNRMSLEDGQATYEVRSQQALTTFSQMGFGAGSPPMVSSPAGPVPYQGHVPTNLPDLDDTQLGHQMGLLSEWNNYVQQKLAEASVQLAKSKSIMEHVEAQLRIAYKIDDDTGKSRSNPERDDYMTCDSRFVKAKSEWLYWDSLYTAIRAVANSAEQAFAAVSRRITQRGQSIDRENRTGTTTGHTNIPSGPMFGAGRRG